MQDDSGRTYGKSEADKRSEAFDAGMAILCDMHKRELSAATLRAYFEIFDAMSADVVRETLRRAIEGERFFPTIAVLKAYAGGVPDASGRVNHAYKPPVYSAEEAADIARMRQELNKIGAAMPWSRGLTQ
jgi:hypothetical protein